MHGTAASNLVLDILVPRYIAKIVPGWKCKEISIEFNLLGIAQEENERSL
jgi:hypothetical protein